jgi:Tfp pilus assembly protein PilE
MPRFRIRTLMIVVAVVALLLAAIGPCRQWYRRWSFHRAEAVRFAKLEAQERLNTERERAFSADRGAIRARSMTMPHFAASPPGEREKFIDRVVEFHEQTAEQSQAAARRWAEQRKGSEAAAFWAFDPFAPDAP